VCTAECQKAPVQKCNDKESNLYTGHDSITASAIALAVIESCVFGGISQSCNNFNFAFWTAPKTLLGLNNTAKVPKKYFGTGFW